MPLAIYTVHLPESVPISFLVLAFLIAVVILNFTITTLTEERPFDDFEIVSIPEKGLGPKQSWIQDGRAVVTKGAKSDKPFQVITGTGPKLVLPNRFANELKSDLRLSFGQGF